MSDYESSYEEYKQALLRSVHFRDKLREKYANTLYAERNYIDNNGVLAKIGILSAAFGSCIIMCWLDIHFAIRIVAAVIATVCFFRSITNWEAIQGRLRQEQLLFIPVWQVH